MSDKLCVRMTFVPRFQAQEIAHFFFGEAGTLHPLVLILFVAGRGLLRN